MKGSAPDPDPTSLGRPSLAQSLVAWGSLTVSRGLEARSDLINAINIHNERPGGMGRAMVCSSFGLPPEDGKSGSQAPVAQRLLGRRRRPQSLLNTAGSLAGGSPGPSPQPGGGEGAGCSVSHTRDLSPRETSGPQAPQLPRGRAGARSQDLTLCPELSLPLEMCRLPAVAGGVGGLLSPRQSLRQPSRGHSEGCGPAPSRAGSFCSRVTRGGQSPSPGCVPAGGTVRAAQGLMGVTRPPA